MHPNGSELAADFATLVIRVENVLEAPRLYECLQAQGIPEEQSKAQLASRMYIESDDGQESLNCNWTASKWQYFLVVSPLANRLSNSFLDSQVQAIQDCDLSGQSAIKRKGRKRIGWGALVDVWKHDGVILDYESEPVHQLTLECISKDHKIASQSFIVRVLDVNEPPTFQQPLFQYEFLENLVTMQTFNMPQLAVRATDPDADAYLTFSILSQGEDMIAGMFELEKHSGNLSAKLDVEFDRECREWYNFTVLVSDGGNPTLNATARVSIHILDRNDNRPVLLRPPHFAFGQDVRESHILLPCEDTQHSIGLQALAFDADLDQAGIVSYEILHVRAAATESDFFAISDRQAKENYPIFAIDSNSGEILLKNEVSCSLIGYTVQFRVQAVDSVEPFHTSNGDITFRFLIVENEALIRRHVYLFILLFIFLGNFFLMLSLCTRRLQSS